MGSPYSRPLTGSETLGPDGNRIGAETSEATPGASPDTSGVFPNLKCFYRSDAAIKRGDQAMPRPPACRNSRKGDRKRPEVCGSPVH